MIDKIEIKPMFNAVLKREFASVLGFSGYQAVRKSFLDTKIDEEKALIVALSKYRECHYIPIELAQKICAAYDSEIILDYPGVSADNPIVFTVINHRMDVGKFFAQIGISYQYIFKLNFGKVFLSEEKRQQLLGFKANKKCKKYSASDIEWFMKEFLPTFHFSILKV